MVLQPHAQQRVVANFATIRYHGIAMISTVAMQKMFSERGPPLPESFDGAVEPHEQADEKQSLQRSRKMLSGPRDHLANGDAVGGAGKAERLRQ